MDKITISSQMQQIIFFNFIFFLFHIQHRNVEGLFDQNWHKLHLSVMDDRVSVYIDCRLKSTVAIQPRGVIDTRGEVSIGRTLMQNTPVVVSIMKKIRWYSKTS